MCLCFSDGRDGIWSGHGEQAQRPPVLRELPNRWPQQIQERALAGREDNGTGQRLARQFFQNRSAALLDLAAECRDVFALGGVPRFGPVVRIGGVQPRVYSGNSMYSGGTCSVSQTPLADR